MAISNEIQHGRHHEPAHQPQPFQRPAEEVLATEHVEIERKTFHLTARANHMGGFVRITEEDKRGNRRNTVIVPSAGVAAFIKAMQQLEKSL